MVLFYGICDLQILEMYTVLTHSKYVKLKESTGRKWTQVH